MLQHTASVCKFSADFFTGLASSQDSQPAAACLQEGYRYIKLGFSACFRLSAGRVKTLHPSVHGGILARRGIPEHMSALEQHSIGTIDVVVVNLYPFRQTVTAAQAPTYDVAVENIDIGEVSGSVALQPPSSSLKLAETSVLPAAEVAPTTEQ